jgi:hypothetical protein
MLLRKRGNFMLLLQPEENNVKPQSYLLASRLKIKPVTPIT